MPLHCQTFSVTQALSVRVACHLRMSGAEVHVSNFLSQDGMSIGVCMPACAYKFFDSKQCMGQNATDPHTSCPW